MRIGFNELQDQKIHMVILKLRLTEQKVKAHEMAHKVVGGPYAGQVHYTYTYGPDGRLYVTGGEVAIDTSEERSPEETIRKMQIVRAAALAPADPSPQDYQVAAMATQREMQARLKLAAEKKKEFFLDKQIKGAFLDKLA